MHRREGGFNRHLVYYIYIKCCAFCFSIIKSLLIGHRVKGTTQFRQRYTSYTLKYRAFSRHLFLVQYDHTMALGTWPWKIKLLPHCAYSLPLKHSIKHKKLLPTFWLNSLVIFRWFCNFFRVFKKKGKSNIYKAFVLLVSKYKI